MTPRNKQTRSSSRCSPKVIVLFSNRSSVGCFGIRSQSVIGNELATLVSCQLSVVSCHYKIATDYSQRTTDSFLGIAAGNIAQGRKRRTVGICRTRYVGQRERR